MIRKSTISLKFGNKDKLAKLNLFVSEYTRVVNLIIDDLWKNQLFRGTFCPQNILNSLNTWLRSRTRQCAGKQALSIIKTQRKRKIKPLFSGKSIELDQRLIEIQDGKKSLFDLWIKFKVFGNRQTFYVPSKKHYHYNLFEDCNKKKSVTLRARSGDLYLDVYFERPVRYRFVGRSIGIDCGYKKLAITSDGQVVGKNLEQKIDKINRKKQGSKAFKRSLIERNQYIDKEIKKIKLEDISNVVVENLKSIKYRSKGKIRKQFNNKLQRWVYPYFLNRLGQRCEAVGVQYRKVDPSYTSQTCNLCGFVHKSNRVSEKFKCGSCGHTNDADLNASLNILNRFRLQETTIPVQVVEANVINKTSF
jgi:IS605 OrfB family transposase